MGGEKYRLIDLLFTFSPIPIPQSTLAAKQVELDDCKKRMVFLEEQLRVAQRQTDRATLLKLKKVKIFTTCTCEFVVVELLRRCIE